MAGLIRDNFKDEVLTELSWIMRAIDDISSKLDIETYEIILIKYRVQPEEERVIDQFIALHYKELDSFSVKDIQEILAEKFHSMTQKPWTVQDHVVEKLIHLRRQELGI